MLDLATNGNPYCYLLVDANDVLEYVISFNSNNDSKWHVYRFLPDNPAMWIHCMEIY